MQIQSISYHSHHRIFGVIIISKRIKKRVRNWIKKVCLHCWEEMEWNRNRDSSKKGQCRKKPSKIKEERVFCAVLCAILGVLTIGANFWFLGCQNPFSLPAQHFRRRYRGVLLLSQSSSSYSSAIYIIQIERGGERERETALSHSTAKFLRRDYLSVSPFLVRSSVC